MAKVKKQNLTAEELLVQALVPEDGQPCDVPENWVWTRLGIVAKWGSGGTPSRRKPEYYMGNILWVKTGELDNDFIYDTEEKISEEALKKSSAKLFPPNTIVIAMYGATIGKAAILGIEATTNQACACGVSSLVLYYKYLFYYAVSQKENFIKMGKGGAQPNISQEIIKAHPIPLPPLAEQQRIVDRIESLFAKLERAKELAQNALDTFETRKAAILHKAFTGELTAKWREKDGVGMDSWKEIRLGELLNPMITKKPDKDKQTFRYIDIDAIDNNIQTVSEPKTILVSEAPSRASRSVEIGNALFSLVRPYLKNIAYIGEELSDCIASTGFYVCRCKPQLNSMFLYQLLCSQDTINYYTSYMKGDNSPSIRKDDFEGLIVNLPSIPEQQEIVRILDSLFEKEQRAKKLCDVIEKIDLIKKAILTRAFRGEFGTNDPAEENAVEQLKRCLVTYN